ncbi:WD40 repeat-like protein, partial [Athelia psychrophila]
VHPYADTAWKVLSLVYKAYQHQKETDANVVALFDKMAALYSFVDDIEEGLPSKIKRLEGTIVRVLEKTTECGKFFREYTEHKFSSRFLGQMTSNKSQVVSDLSSSLGQLQKDLNLGVVLQTAFKSSQTHELMGRFGASNSLDPANMDTAIRASCLAGTREDLLKEIIDWLITPSEGQNVLWLHGAAGLGKSTLANSIAKHFRGRRQQGAYLFFDRNAPLESNPARVIRTLAYQLAEHDQAIKTAISLAMEKDPQLTSELLSTQFTSLLMNPLSAASREITGPVIIVLDALDECGDAESRRALLTLLSDELAKLPRQFRFLIISRPDADIERAFKSAGHMHAIDLSMSASNADVLLYIKHEMGQIYSSRRSYDELPLGWPSLLEVQRLAAFAAGLFIWAATAMKFLRQTDDPVECLSSLLGHDREVFTLDELYKTALMSASEWKPGKVNNAFRQVLGLIVIGQIPLTNATISELLGFEDSGKQCRIALRRLGCVIQWSEGKPARTFHKSFPDYLTDRSRCSAEPWFVDVQAHHRALTIHSFRLMKSQLRFNICNLTNSHLLNKGVPDLPARIQSSIPESLSYACRFWMDHLEQTPTGDSVILTLILEFFEHQFLCWLEVLSLLQHIPTAAIALNRVKLYAMDPKSDLHAFAQDGISFVRTFASVITESVPHIYLSCIAFAPRSSILKQRYSSVVPKTLVVHIGLQAEWPPCQQVIVTGESVVFSVAFSPNGQCIASGSADGTIRVWDAEYGALTAGPFTGHTEPVTSVVFSPDGQRIASGSWNNTIRVWNAESGALKAGPFTGHTQPVYSVVFSPDGQRIASGSHDKTIRVWDAESGALKAGPFTGHSEAVTSVVFSPDGQHIASGSNDKTIRVWDAELGALKAGPFTGHTGGINSVVFSLEGQRIASGSNDKTIRVWDAESGALKAGPFIGHTEAVTSVVFSPDGQRIASGSWDHVICVWNPESGAPKAGPFIGHTQPVYSVVFSPDGQRMASGSNDRTIRVWDAEYGALKAGPFTGHAEDVNSVVRLLPGEQCITSGSNDKDIRIWNTIRVWDAESGALKAGPFTGHTDWVNSVVFSPDGQCIASGSHDGTICVWHAASGALKAGPFRGHTDWVNSVAFSPDGQRVASGSNDNTIRVWDAASGALQAGPFTGHTDRIRSIAFSPDGHCVASASDDGTTRIWNVQQIPAVLAKRPPSDGFQHDSRLDQNGWMLNKSSSLLFWVPHIYRVGLWSPCNTAVIAPESTQLDMTRFVHGEDWAQCHI